MTDDYEQSDSGRRIIRRTRVDQDEVIVAADHIRHPSTGVHARIAIFFNDALLVASTFNIDRDEELVRLANSAHRMLPASIQELYLANELKYNLTTFCFGLWDEYVGGQVAELSGSDNDDDACTFALEPYVMDNGGTILFAPPGAGKSITMLTMAVCIDAGLNHLWHTCQRKVLIVNLERSRKSVEARLRRVNRCLDIDPGRKMLCLHKRGARLADLLPAIERSVQQHDVEVVFLDSISRAGYGDLTANEPCNAIMDALNATCPTWLAIGHTPRSDPSHVYGGVHFDAAADMCVQVLTERTEEALGVGLQVTKANEIAPPPLYVLALEFDQHGVMAISKARPHQFPDIEAGKKASLWEEIEDYLGLVGQASATDISREIGRDRSNVSRTLNADPRFVVVGKKGPAVLYSLKSYLEA